ncbi:Pro-kumamolisin [Diplocarpon rosae]|nr:Pro-kumamolisin [Diplocarpon rosae]
MLSEGFITSILAQPKSANTAVAKDLGIHLHELHPISALKSSFKKSSTKVNGLAANSSHIFAAQADKAVVHVYSREKGNQEALISFPERIHTVTLLGDGILVLGTAEGRAILWEVCTGRQVSTAAAHLQPISCLAGTQSHLITGSEDSNIHVWSVPHLLAMVSTETVESLRTLSNHRAAITNLATGHSASATNICVSASRDNTVIVWDYLSGDLLRTFLLPSTPLCLALDPCDRAAYIGFEDASLQVIEFLSGDSTRNSLYDRSLQSTPVQVTLPPWTSQVDSGPTLCLGLSYDGTCLLSGHASGKIIQWDVPRRAFTAELADLNAPVTNLLMMPVFPSKKMTRALTVVKPRLGQSSYTFTAQLTGSLKSANDYAAQSRGFPPDMLERAIQSFSAPLLNTSSSSGDEQLRIENEDLWKVHPGGKDNMRFEAIFRIFAALVVVTTASPVGSLSRHVIHEKRGAPPSKWARHSRLHPSTVIPVRIGLAQQNLHRAEEFINEVAHPESKSYGKHWSRQKVVDMFSPSQESIGAVQEWLSNSGIDESRLQMSKSRTWITFNATTSEAERLLKAEYHLYRHEAGHSHVACKQYSVPAHLVDHIDIVTPSIHFDQQLGNPRRTMHHSKAPPPLRELNKRQSTKRQTNPQHGIVGSPSDASNPKQGAFVNNALMSLENCDTMITPACLQALYNSPPGSTAMRNNTLGVVEYTPQAFLQDDLDMFFKQFMPGMTATQPNINLIDGAIVQQTNKSFQFNGESALDLEFAMALVAPQQVTVYQVGDIVSGASFNNFLDAIDGSYCSFAGGDSKDPSVDGQYPSNQPGGFQGSETCGSFQSTNVISTSYGSNEADLSDKYETRQCMEYMKLGLQGVSILYSSGDFGVAGNGGQCIDSVTGAYNNGTKGLFNPSFPGGCPYRINAKKSPIGFVNPVLYANPEVLNDVTNGGNQGCGTEGFQSVPGWDPVTGLGTPNFPKMMDLFMSLP